MELQLLKGTYVKETTALISLENPCQQEFSPKLKMRPAALFEWKLKRLVSFVVWSVPTLEQKRSQRLSPHQTLSIRFYTVYKENQFHKTVWVVLFSKLLNFSLKHDSMIEKKLLLV